MLSLLMAAVLAQGADLDAALDRLAGAKPGDGAAYLVEREKVLAFGKDAIPALAERSRAARWTESGWVRALAAEVCRLRLADPELADVMSRLDELDPARYRLNRHAQPSLRELAHRGANAVPFLIERWRWTFDLHTFSEGEAGEIERAALRQAILSIPGRVSDVRARHFLAEVLATPGLRGAWRGEAAVSLGSVGGTAALQKLTAVLDDATTSADLREACARALGRIADASALDAIRSRLATETNELVRRSFLHGLGILGSSWGWASRGKEAAAAGDAIRAGCAETLVQAIRNHPTESQTIGVALAMTAWAPSLKSVEDLASDASATDEVRAAAAKILPALRQALSRKK